MHLNRLDKKHTVWYLKVTILCQTVAQVSFTNSVFFIWTKRTFLGYVLGCWTFFGYKNLAPFASPLFPHHFPPLPPSSPITSPSSPSSPITSPSSPLFPPLPPSLIYLGGPCFSPTLLLCKQETLLNTISHCKKAGGSLVIIPARGNSYQLPQKRIMLSNKHYTSSHLILKLHRQCFMPQPWPCPLALPLPYEMRKTLAVRMVIIKCFVI